MPKLGRRTERSRLEVQVPAPILPRDRPYGTDFTPLFASRIIGGKHVPVLERPYKVIGDLDRQPHIERVVPVADKPNYVDPRIIKEYSRKFGVHRSTTQDEDLYGISTTANRRPDSKDINRKYPTLPAINVNKVKNMDMSTIFEPEPWTHKYRNRTNVNNYDPNDYENEMNNQNDQQRFNHPAQAKQSSFRQNEINDINSRHRTPPRKVKRDIKQELLRFLPISEFLPQRPIRLNEDEEWELLKLIGDELQGEEPLKLRHVYIHITKNGDRQMSGWCPYKNLVYALQDIKVNLSSDLIRIVAAQFIDPHHEFNKVNYEKFLSFVGTALKNFGKSPRAGRYSPIDFKMIGEKPAYYDDRPVTPMTERMEHIFNDREVTKLLQTTEQQLKADDYEINFEKLIAEFQYVDREFRETLSYNQVKEIFRDFRLPLTESLLKQILNRCQDLNKDGQYNWIKIVYFLERVQPSRTGLYIPRSKQPLEYAKQIPQPSTEWPRAKSPPPHTPLWRKEEQPKEEAKDNVMYNTTDYDRDILDTKHPTERDSVIHGQSEINRMDKELKELEKNYEVMKRNMKADNMTPWFKRFMDMAQALYAQDVTNSGILTYDDVWNLTRLHNEASNLNIPNEVILGALKDSVQGGGINIHPYLTRLGNRDWQN